MVKTILKEVIIILLLCVAILLVLSILFYDYSPINKVVPNKIAYTTPENIRNELEEENIQDDFTVQNKVYTIEGSDLNIYRKSNSYNPSKENPFASTPSEDTNTTGTGESVKVNEQGNTQKTNNISNVGSSNNNTGLK